MTQSSPFKNSGSFRFGSSLAALLVAGLATSSAHAQAAGDESAVDTGEIVVTAQRRSQELQKVPIAVTAISPETIQNMNIKTIDNIQNVTPGLVFDTGNGFPQMYIRGIGFVTTTPGLEQPVALYVDGAYMPRANGTLFDMVDISSVQVLKGPQGTLYGRNATGGAILVTTSDPTDHFEAKGSLEYGRFNRTRAETVVNLPVSETVAFRFAGLYIREDGFVRNIAVGQDVRGTKGYSLRGKVKWAPSSDFSAVLGAEYQHNDSKSLASGRQAAPAPFCVPCKLGAPNAPGFYQVNEDLTITNPQRSKSVYLNVEYEGDSISAKSITSYRDIDYASAADVDHSPLSLLGVRVAFGGGTFEQNFQLSSSFSGPVNFLAGVQYVNDRAYARQATFGNLFGIARDIPKEQQVYSDGIITTESIAVFGEAYFVPAEGVTLTAGGRYSSDKRQNTASITPLAQVRFAPGGSPTFTERSGYTKFTPRLVAAYDAGLVTMYVSYTKGFKAGGLTSRYAPGDHEIAPENIASYEIGAKYVSPDRRTRINISAFRYSYKDIQVSIIDAVRGGNITSNAASARGKGFEVEASHRLSEWLTMSVGAGYLDVKYRDYRNAPNFVIARDSAGNPTGYTNGAIDLSGSRLPRAPKLILTASADLEIPFGPDWTGRLTPSFRHSSGYDFVIGAGGPARNDRQPKLNLISVSGGIRPSSGRYEIGFYVDNLLDQKYYTQIVTSTFGYEVYVAKPITYGLRVKFQM